MPAVVKTRIIKIGNSQGIRIPKILLDQVDLGGQVALELRGDQIVVRPLHRDRHDWEELFEAMARQGDDKLLDGDASLPTIWDEEEWEW